jgi:hypothetical protein
MYAIAVLPLIAGASALTIPRANKETCDFTLTASGGKSGTIGQLHDGQNRIGGGLPPHHFKIHDGGITDDSGEKGCILTRKSFFSVR